MLASTAPSMADSEAEYADQFEDQFATISDPAHASKAPAQQFVGVAVPSLTFPTSAYDNCERPHPLADESQAITKLLSEDSAARDQYAGSDFVSLDLEDFAVYRRELDSPLHYGLCPLDQVAVKQGDGIFYFDGVLRNQGGEDSSQSFYVERVPFRLVSIGGYEDLEQHTVGDDIWIQSTFCQKRGMVWYRLGTPAAGYKEYHNAFTWVANLAKHFVDYLAEHNDVTLEYFRSNFSTWLMGHHGTDTAFMEWHSEYGRPDFRQAIMAHANFLLRQSLNIDVKYERHTVWREINFADPIVKQQPQKVEGTVVTPYVEECFKDMDWSHHLRTKAMDPAAQAKHRAHIRNMGFYKSRKVPIVSLYPQRDDVSAPILGGADTIRIGDVIATWKDEVSKWKGRGELWYAVVQGIQTYEKQPARLSLIWLYHPSETVCANMTYPHNKELFMSDHCNCGDGKIDTTQVVRKVGVAFFASRAEGKADFFVRQMYSSDEETFTTLSECHFCCPCRKLAPASDYEKGDTVLVEGSDTKDLRLEPAEIVKFEGENKVIVRTFLRRARDFEDSSCRPNELVYTDRMRTIHKDQIEARCHIRFYTEEERKNGSIPVPYNRDGTGRAFYISVREVGANGTNLQPMAQPDDFKAGFDPNDDGALEKLRALNLFCGGGSFDRGLEEGSAIQSEWAVEWELAPMLTYRANHSKTKDKGLYCGSVNDYLASAFRGNESIAQIGQVEFISGGSPCQGYSQANGQKSNETSLRNSSMIASVASFIDFYRPKYAILENVTQMAGRHHKKNPFSQLICAFVGMGYQVRVLNLDAWNYGAPQSRSRLFIIVAAPGLHLPEYPFPTHSHPQSTRHGSLGEAPNGLPFGRRRFETPVFDFISASQGTKDIPRIDMGRITPISWPDHRLSQGVSLVRQKVTSSIPKAPRGMGLANAVSRGFVIPEDKGPTAKWRSPGRCWTRVGPDSLISTVTTFVSPWCKFAGRWLHWDEDRTLTVMEARRAQGFPDHEVLIGSATQQWKVVGNSVARQVALVLGLSVREACMRNKKAGLGLALPVAALSSSDLEVEQVDSSMVSDVDTAGGQLFTELENSLVKLEDSEMSRVGKVLPQQPMKCVMIDNGKPRNEKPRRKTPGMIIEETTTTTTTVTTTTRKTTRYSFSSRKLADDSDSEPPVSRNKTPRRSRVMEKLNADSDSEPVSNGNKRKHFHESRTETTSLSPSLKRSRFKNK